MKPPAWSGHALGSKKDKIILEIWFLSLSTPPFFFLCNKGAIRGMLVMPGKFLRVKNPQQVLDERVLGTPCKD